MQLCGSVDNVVAVGARAPIRRPELVELETFLVSVRAGSIAGAAAQLGVSRTTAAKRIALLEVTLGSSLLHRGPRGVTPTEAGEELVPVAERMLSEVDRASEWTGAGRASAERRSVAGAGTRFGDAPRSAEQTSALFAEVFHRVDQGILIARIDDGVIVDVNEALCRLMERDRGEIVGLTREQLNVESPAGAAGYLEELRRSGAVAEYEVTFSPRPGTQKRLVAATRVIEVEGEALAVSTVRETTRRERLQAQLLQLYSVVVRPGARAATTHDLYERICRVAVQEGGFTLAWVGELDEDTGVVSVVAAEGLTDYLAGLRVTLSPDLPEGRGPTATALREMRPVTCTDIATDPMMRPWRERALAHGLVASASFPFLAGIGARAVLNVYATEASLLTGEQRSLLEDLALDTSLTLDATRLEAERFREALAGSELTAFTMDRDLRYTWMENPGLGYTSDQVLGRTDAELLPPDAAAAVSALKRRVIDGESVDEEIAITRGGKVQWFWLTAKPIFDASGAITGLAGQTTDITKRKELELHLRNLADRDPLTGVYNSRRMLEEIDRGLAYARRTGRPGGLLLFDLDHLKLTNDSFGHSAGDAMLRTVAKVLCDRVRQTDFVARIGGDEFAVLSPDASGDDLLALAGDVRERLRAQHLGPTITASVGIACYSGEQQLTGEEVLVCADTALYEAKEHGGDQARVYSGTTTGTLTWVARIRAAIDGNRLVLHAQPIVDLRTGEPAHQELLVRMVADDGQVILPSQFIPTAERFGLIRDLDRWVTNAGLGLARSGARVAINLSGQSIGEQPIIDSVRTAIAEGLDPANVIFEITETAALRNLAEAPAFAATLSGLGCAVALDDFGTGFGSFTYLKHIPARYLKIDREFVRELASSETDRQVVKGIVGIARSLNKLTIAEGVENAETLAVAKELGVDQAQGFFFQRPRLIRAAGVTDLS